LLDDTSHGVGVIPVVSGVPVISKSVSFVEILYETYYVDPYMEDVFLSC